MFRTVLALGICAVLGVVALKLVFGVLGPLVAIFLWILSLALRVALVGVVIYLILRVVSPETARRMRARFDEML